MVLSLPIASLLPATPDSARVVAHAYSASLSALLPVAIAAVGGIILRKSEAATRAALWRATVIAMLIVCAGAFLPTLAVAAVVPAGLASPLVMLGRMQVGAPLSDLLSGQNLAASSESLVVRLLFVVYLIGFLVVGVPVVFAAIRLVIQTYRTGPTRDVRLLHSLDEAISVIGVRRRVRLVVSSRTRVPMTWGVVRPTILLPTATITESDGRLRAVLLHELSHIRSGDAAFAALSRLACAVLWFHPAAWWLDRRLREDCEVACDDRVLATGVRQSDYAELLIDACDRLHGHRPPELALTICRATGLRQRLSSILDPARERRRASRLAGAVAMSLTLTLSIPASMVQLAPTRSVLNSLMRDQRWESRAYAVLGLAQRPDSIEIARSAASADPDPKVRAWARYALSLEPIPASPTK